MVTVIKTPLGHKLTEAELDATVGTSGGDALFTTAFAHGLVDGDYIYIQSDIESYNGFKYVDETAYNSFKIRDSENSAAVAYKQDVDVVYKISVLQHGWLCVHLPIVYELESDLYPTNVDGEAYTPNTVVSQADYEGYTLLNLSAALEDPTELAWVQVLSGIGGVYQITHVFQPWQVVINLSYDVANSFGPIIKYYNNYCINVNIYAGLPAGHRWEQEKEYELAAVLQLIPDADNKVKFSISDILRGYINVRNNLTLDSLPNNLDFFTGFYITYFESYDDSDGEEIFTHETSQQIDSFEGVAVNAKLPFKSENISHLSDYINEDTYLAQWLTLQTNPLTLVNRFFDLSFLLRFSGVDVIISQNGVDILTIENPGLGVIRVPLEFDTAGEFCIQARTPGGAGVPGNTTAITLPALNLWTSGGGSGEAWTLGGTPTVNLPGNFPTVSTSEYLVASYAFIPGYEYAITIDYTNIYNSGSSNPKTIRLSALDDALTEIFTTTEVAPSTPGGSDTITLTFTATAQTTKIGVLYASGADVDVEIDARSGTVTSPDTPAVAAQTLTEEICITVLEECDSTILPDVDDIRLLEDGDFRILE